MKNSQTQTIQAIYLLRNSTDSICRNTAVPMHNSELFWAPVTGLTYSGRSGHPVWYLSRNCSRLGLEISECR